MTSKILIEQPTCNVYYNIVLVVNKFGSSYVNILLIFFIITNKNWGMNLGQCQTNTIYERVFGQDFIGISFGSLEFFDRDFYRVRV